MTNTFDPLKPEVYFPIYGTNPVLGVKQDIFLDDHAYRIECTDLITAPIRTDVTVDLKLVFASAIGDYSYDLDDYRLILRKMIWRIGNDIHIDSHISRLVNSTDSNRIINVINGDVLETRGVSGPYPFYNGGTLDWKTGIIHIPSAETIAPGWDGALLGYEVALVKRNLFPRRSFNTITL